MAASDPQFLGSEDPRIGLVGVHRWYRFRRSDGSEARVGMTSDAAAARRAAGDDETAIDDWAIATGLRILTERPGDATNEVVLDVPTGGDRHPRRGNTLTEPGPGD